MYRAPNLNADEVNSDLSDQEPIDAWNISMAEQQLYAGEIQMIE